MSRVRLLAAAAASGLCLVAAAPALAQAPGNPPGKGIQCPNRGGVYPPGQRCTGTMSDPTVGRGGGPRDFTTPPVFTPGEGVNGTGRSTPFALGTFTADRAGRVSGTVNIPAGLEAGPHRLEFTGLSSGEFVVVPFTVAGVRGRAAAPLASTGSSSTVPLVSTGVGLVLVGSLVVVTARRRRDPVGLAV